MKQEECDPVLSEWAKTLRCAEAVSVPGRKMLGEPCDAEAMDSSSNSSSSSKKHRQVMMLVCSDVIILCGMRKRSTFSRRHKSQVTLLPVQDLSYESDAGKNMLTLCARGSDGTSLVFGSSSKLERASGLVALALQNKSSHGNGKGVSALENKSPNVGGAGIASKKKGNPVASAEASAKAKTDSVKINTVFDRMAMWIDVDDGSKKEGSVLQKNRKNELQCINVFREIVNTETAYVDDLRKLVVEYVEPLEEKCASNEYSEEELISDQDLQLIFGTVGAILNLNEELRTNLHLGVLKISRNGDIPDLCQVAGVFAKEFQRVMPFFKMYAAYCHQYNDAIEKLCELRETNRELGAFLQRREARERNQQASLRDLLIKPVQRICKYPLLFRELLGYVGKIERPGDTEFEQHVAELQGAEQEVNEIAASVNTRVSDAKNQDQFIKIFAELGGEAGCPGLLTPTRRLLRFQDVLMREAPFAENKKLKHRMYVFNDLIVFAKPLSNGMGTLGKMGGTLGRAKAVAGQRYKKTLSFELGQVKHLKPVLKVDEESRHAFELCRVSRVTATRLTPGDSGGSTKNVTAILRYEVWFDSKQVCESCSHEIEAAVAAACGEKQDLKNRSSTNIRTMYNSNSMKRGSAGAEGTSTRRWANRTRARQWRTTGGDNTMEMTGTLERARKTYQQPPLKDNKATANDDAQVTKKKESLPQKQQQQQQQPPPPQQGTCGASNDNDEIFVSRYATARQTIQPVSQKGGVAQIKVSFPDGPMGIALQNSSNPKGVLVACVAAYSVAERGGVAVGDRVIQLNTEAVPSDMNWNQVVDVIKSLPRPLKITFERTPETLFAGFTGSGSARRQRAAGSSMKNGNTSRDPSRSPSSSPDKSPSSTSPGQGQQRQWASKLEKRKAATGTFRLLSLKELEACYKASSDVVQDTAKDALAVLDELEAGFTTSPKTACEKQTCAVLREIFCTEKEYVCDLRKLIGEYLLPLRQSSRTLGLEPEDEQTIFMHVENILKINTELLKSLSSKIKQQQMERQAVTLQKVIDVCVSELTTILPFFKVYASFCHHYSTALARLVACRQSNAALDQFLTQRESRAENKHDSLQSLLIKPAQRICKYPLLLGSLRQAAGSLPQARCSLACLAKLKSAVGAAESMAAQVNAKVSEAVNTDKVVELYSQFGGQVADLVEPHRRFVTRAQVSMLKAPFHESKPSPTTLLVFNDLVIFADEKKRNSRGRTNLKLVHRVDLGRCDVKPLSKKNVQKDHVEEEMDAFQLTQVIRTVRKSQTASTTKYNEEGKVTTSIEKFRVSCTSPRECACLYAEIKTCIKTLGNQDANRRNSLGGASKRKTSSTGGQRRQASRITTLEELESKYNKH